MWFNTAMDPHLPHDGLALSAQGARRQGRPGPAIFGSAPQPLGQTHPTLTGDVLPLERKGGIPQPHPAGRSTLHCCASTSSCAWNINQKKSDMALEFRPLAEDPKGILTVRVGPFWSQLANDSCGHDPRCITHRAGNAYVRQICQKNYARRCPLR